MHRTSAAQALGTSPDENLKDSIVTCICHAFNKFFTVTKMTLDNTHLTTIIYQICC
jgi:hypothetical protein